MAVSLFTNPRYRTALLIIASILVVAVAAIGTIFLIKQYAPSKEGNSTQKAVTDDKSPLDKAKDLFAKGDYAAAKAQYQSILEDYKSQKNEAGVKDIEMQLKVLEATAKAPVAPQNTNKGKVTVGSATEQ